MDNHQKSTRAEGYRVIYTNNIMLGSSAFDMMLVCLQNIVDAEGGRRTEEQVVVAMSLEHAKQFSRVLSIHLQQMEKQVGPIREVSTEPLPWKEERGQ